MKPLHVRVAEAIGVVVKHHQVRPACAAGCGCREIGEWWEVLRWSEDADPDWDHDEVPRYDTDWKATGPLIERYQITLQYSIDHWRAWPWMDSDSGCLLCPWQRDAKPLTAVCKLILALAKAGKLRAGA